MSDPIADAVFGRKVEGDPYEGLPPHMRESVPHVVTVKVAMPMQHAVLHCPDRPMDIENGIAHVHHDVQLERDGKPLTKNDAPPSWRRGEADGWTPRLTP